MLAEANYISAFLVGLLGGVHCVGMCGAIVGAMSVGLPTATRGKVGRQLPFLVSYNLGRIVSYGVAGMLLGGIGGLVVSLGELHVTRQILQVVAGLFMFVLGLYLADWWRGLAQLERAGGYLWKRIEPLGRRLLPVNDPPRALLAGLIWGWLPCGLVYSVLIWSMAAGSWWEGGLLMLSFGVGTLPNLLLAGIFAARITGFVRDIRVRRVAGGLVMLLGLAYIANALEPYLSGAAV